MVGVFDQSQYMDNKQGNILIIVLVVIVVGIVGAVFLYSSVIDDNEDGTTGVSTTATQMPTITPEPTDGKFDPTATPTSVLPTSTPANPYINWNQCENSILALSIKFPPAWTCEVEENNDSPAGPLGEISITGNNFAWEISNYPQGYGCNLAPNCTHTEIYDGNLITIYLLTDNGEDKYMFGVFKDNSDDRSYGGIRITYEDINSRKMTAEEKDTLIKMLDSMVRK